MAETRDSRRRQARRRRVSTGWLFLLALAFLIALAVLLFPFFSDVESGPFGPYSSAVLRTLSSDGADFTSAPC